MRLPPHLPEASVSAATAPSTSASTRPAHFKAPASDAQVDDASIALDTEVAGIDDVLAAAARIAPHAHVTPVLRSGRIDAQVGTQLHFKAEHLQRTGAFKFRGACNAVWSLSDADAARGVVTHSSGNHGAALALAARTRGIACHVVVPDGAVRSKVIAIDGYGGIVHRCAPGIAAREHACAALQAATGAAMVHPYTDPRVIAGQGTAALELLREAPPLDVVIVPVGGGGLAAGTVIACAAMSPATQVILAEPAGAADTFASLRDDVRRTDISPDTLCDGLRGTIGAANFALLQRARIDVLTVSDADTVAAMRLLWQTLKQVVEPSSAIALAAVLAARDRFAGQRIGIVLSGGNVDLDALPWVAG